MRFGTPSRPQIRTSTSTARARMAMAAIRDWRRWSNQTLQWVQGLPNALKRRCMRTYSTLWKQVLSINSAKGKMDSMHSSNLSTVAGLEIYQWPWRIFGRQRLSANRNGSILWMKKINSKIKVVKLRMIQETWTTLHRQSQRQPYPRSTLLQKSLKSSNYSYSAWMWHHLSPSNLLWPCLLTRQAKYL